jgi:hypothetical protein
LEETGSFSLRKSLVKEEPEVKCSKWWSSDYRMGQEFLGFITA